MLALWWPYGGPMDNAGHVGSYPGGPVDLAVVLVLVQPHPRLAGSDLTEDLT